MRRKQLVALAKTRVNKGVRGFSANSPTAPNKCLVAPPRKEHEEEKKKEMKSIRSFVDVDCAINTESSEGELYAQVLELAGRAVPEFSEPDVRDVEVSVLSGGITNQLFRVSHRHRAKHCRASLRKRHRPHHQPTQRTLLAVAVP